MLSRRLEYRITGRDESKGAFQSVQRNIRGTAAGVGGLSRQMGSLQATTRAFASGIAAIGAVRDLNRLEQQLIRLRGISTDFAGDQQFLARTSAELSLNLRQFTDTFAQVQGLEAIELIRPGQARELAVGFEQAAARFGVSSADLQLGVRGLRQALTQGTVRAQEFDQIFDAIGAAQPAVARQLGLTTKEFQKLRTANSLVATDLVNALIPALQEFDGSAQARAQSIQGSFNRIATTYQETLLAFQEPTGDLFEGVAGSVEGILGPIRSNAEAIAGSIGAIGTAVVAGFGGRQVARLAAFSNQQRQSVIVSRAHSQALIENTRQQQAATSAELANARAAQASLTVQRQQLQTQLAAARSSTARLSIQNQLSAARLRETAATTALVAANASYRRDTERLSTVTRNATVRATALSVAARGMGAAFSLVGGPVGAAAIALAAIIPRLATTTREFSNIRQAIDDLSRTSFADTEAALARNAEARLFVERQISDLRDRINRQNDGVGVISSVREAAGTAGIFVSNLEDRIVALQGQLSRLNTLTVEPVITESTASIYVDRIQRMAAETDSLNARLSSINVDDIFKKLLPNDSKISELQSVRSELELLVNNGRIGSDEFNRLNGALTEQISKLNGVADARKRASDAQADALQVLERLEDSFLTERERLVKEFEDTSKNLVEIQVSLGTENVNESRIAEVQRQLNAELNRELDELNRNDIEQERQRLQGIEDARIQKLTQMFNREGQLREARQPIATLNTDGALNQRFIVEFDALQNQFDQRLLAEEEYEISRLNLTRRFGSAQLALEQDRQQQLAQARAERNQITDLSAEFGSGALELFTRQVSNYIDIQQDWTDAEQQRAERSNEINRRHFERNKRIQRAQAIIEGLAAGAKALNTSPFFPTGLLMAGIAAARTAAIVRGINQTSFGTTSANFGGGGTANTISPGGSTSSGNESITQQNQDGGGSTVYFITQIPPDLQDGINPNWLYDNQKRNLQKMIDQDVIDSDAEIRVNSIDAPPILTGIQTQAIV